MHFVYIIYSEKHDIYYKGESADPFQRLLAHNSNLSQFTKDKGPWKLVYIESCLNRNEALKREKMLKKQNRKYLQWLFTQPSNNLR